MPAIDYNIVNDNTDYSHTGDTTWQNKITIGSANIQSADYIFVGQGILHGNTANTPDYEFELRESTTTIANSYNRIEAQSSPWTLTAANGKLCSMMGKYTFNGSSNLNFSIKLQNSANTVYLGQMNFVMIKVDDTDTASDALHSGDYEYAEDQTDLTYGTANVWTGDSGTDPLQSITIGNGSDDYLVFSLVRIRVGSASATFDHRLDVGGVAKEEVNHRKSNTNEETTSLIMTYLAAPAASTVIQPRMRSNSTLGRATANSVLAIRLNAFDDYSGLLNTTPLNISSADTDTERTLTKTSAHESGVAADWLCFGWSQIDYDANDKRIDTYIRQGSSTIVGGAQTGNAGYHWDSTSPFPTVGHFCVGDANINHNTDIDFDFGHQEEQNTTPVIERMSIVAFTADLQPDSGNPITIPVPMGPEW